MAKVSRAIQTELLDPTSRGPREIVEGRSLVEVAPHGIVPEGQALAAWVNGKAIGAEEWGDTLRDGDFVDFALLPEGGELAVTVVIPFVGKVATFTGASAILAIVGATAVQLALANLAIRAIVGDPPKPESAPDDSATHGFFGISRAAFHEGAALPVIYGRHRATGVVINVYTQVFPNPAESFIYMLILLAGHEVDRIGDFDSDGGPFTSAEGTISSTLQIEKQPARNLADVEMHVRLGTPDQTPIPGFEEPREYTEVGITIEPPLGSDQEATPGSYASTDPEITKWENPVAFTMGVDGDSAELQYLFVNGLYNLGSSGALNLREIQVQARYRQVDGGGTPFGNYAVLPKTIFRDNRRTQFPASQVIQFVDPSTYSPASPSQYLILDGTNDHATLASPASGLALPPGSEAFSVYFWFRPDIDVIKGGLSFLPSTVTIKVTGTVYASIEAPNDSGISVRLAKSGVNSGTNLFRSSSGRLIASRDDWLFEILISDGGASPTTYVVSANPNDFMRACTIGGGFDGETTGIFPGAWVMGWISYRADTDTSGNGTLTVGYNLASKAHTIPSSLQPTLWKPGRPLFVGSKNGTPTEPFAGDIEEVVAYQRALSTFEFANKYNLGEGLPASDQEPGIVAGWHLDSEAASVTPSFVNTPSDDLSLVNGAALSVAQTDSPVAGTSIGDPLKARYLIEVQRITEGATSFAGDEVQLAAVISKAFEEFSYPGRALLAVKVRATDQVNTTEPLVTELVRGAKVPIWDGVDPFAPVLVRQWSRNNAWIALDAATSGEYGLGDYFKPTTCDLPAFLAWAAFCDEIVRDGYGLAAVDSLLKQSSAVFGDPTNVPNGVVRIRLVEGNYKARWPPFRNENSEDGYGFHADEFFRLENMDVGAPAWALALEGLDLEMFRVEFNSTDLLVEVYCHAPTDSTETIYDPATVDVGHTERRMRLDNVFDRSDFDAWGALIQIMRAGWASPLLIGSRLSLAVDNAREPVGLVTMGSMIPDTFDELWSGKLDRPNTVIAEFNDEALNFEKKPARFEHTSINDPTKLGAFVRDEISLEGVVRLSQVARHATRDLNLYALATRFVSWEAGPDSLGFQPGDRVEVAHDVPQWGYSGRIWQDSEDGDLVYLDREITIEAAKTYEVQIQYASSGELETQTVSTGTGTYAPGEPLAVSSPFTQAPQKDDLYSFGEVGKVVKSFVLVDTELDPTTLRRKMRGLEYNEAVYDDGIATVPDSVVSSLPPPVVAGPPPPVVALSTEDAATTRPDGSVSSAVRVYWQTNPASLEEAARYAGADIWFGEGTSLTGLRKIGSVGPSDRSFDIPDDLLEVGEDYRVLVQGRAVTGLLCPYAQCPSVTFNVDPLPPPLDAPTNLSARISGDLLALTWDGTDRARAVEFRIGGWVLGTTIGVAPGGAREIEVPLFATASANSAGVSNPKIIARAKNGLGQYGKAATLEFDPVVRDTSNLVDQSEEPSFTGTKTALSVAAAPPQLKSQGVRDQLARLSFSSGLTGSYQVDLPTIPDGQDVYAQFVIEAEQVHPRTWGEAAHAWGDRETLRWTWEGPTWTKRDEDSCALDIMLDAAVGGTVSGTFRRALPSLYHLKASRLRVDVSRPTTDFDVRVKRVAIRYTKKHVNPPDQLARSFFAQ